MPSDVWFMPTESGDSQAVMSEKLAALLAAARLEELVSPGDLVALKTHFGERGNHNFVSPALLKPLVELVRQAGGKPFWTDTNTLYVGRRSNAVDHLLLAHAHGFTIEDTGAPVVIADGLTGREEHRVTVDGEHSREVGIAPGVATANALLVVTHATGHLVSGYGGAIKNLGMGLSSRKGKLYQHSVVKPAVDAERCTGCGACLSWCPEGAITLEGGEAQLDPDLCVGCGECLAACRVGAVTFQWKISSPLLQERMAEQAAGVVRQLKGRVGYVTYVVDVGKDCDCLPSSEEDVLCRSAGILASRDPVALEWATIRVLEEAMGRPLREAAYDVDWTHQLRHAEAMGLGSSEYRLVRLEPPGAGPA